jgi:hypothetical protein
MIDSYASCQPGDSASRIILRDVHGEIRLATHVPRRITRTSNDANSPCRIAEEFPQRRNLA